MDCLITKIADLKLGFHTIRGWIEKVQTFKHHSLLVVRDGAGKDSHVQVYVPKTVQKEPMVCETYVELGGEVKQLPSGAYSFRPFELAADRLVVIGSSCSDFSSRCPSDAGPEVKLEERHLYLRDPKFTLITMLRTILVKALRKTLESMGCTEFFPSLFVGNQCEGGSTLFHLKHPSRDKGDVDAYLTQSSQFYCEYLIPSIGDNFCISESFRAERSQTRRHLTEFLHAECEWKDVFTLEQHLEKLRTLIKGTVRRFLKYGRKYLDELKLTERVEKLLLMTDDILTMTHREAIDYCHKHEIYKDAETKTHFDYEDDIPEMQERAMIDQIDKIVFLTRFPKSFKSFYVLSYEDGTTYSCDVEMPGVGECIGSTVREYDYQKLEAAIEANGLKKEDYREYLDMRKYGSGRTSGMGLGVDRFLTWLLGAFSIREVVTFPRYPGRLFP